MQTLVKVLAIVESVAAPAALWQGTGIGRHDDGRAVIRLARMGVKGTGEEGRRREMDGVGRRALGRGALENGAGSGEHGGER